MRKWIRRVLCVLAALAMLCGAALAEEMAVVNCEEWVSLRAEPSTSAQRLAKVPLGALVENCIYASDGFVACEYQGAKGYILAEYLQPVSAGADGRDMTVVNCEEWVSLRSQPAASADRLAKVPLGATVENCVLSSNGFMQCTYQGVSGYILADYLSASDIGATGYKLFLEVEWNGLTFTAERGRAGEGEALRATCQDAAGTLVWQRELASQYMTELRLTDAFLGGTADQPVALLYVFDGGLFAVDLATGESLWTFDAVDLGGSLTHAVGEDGTVYVGGYYGPDPVAISASGELLWEADSGRDTFWLYDMEITDEGVVCTYDAIDGAPGSAEICYGFDGSVAWVRASGE